MGVIQDIFEHDKKGLFRSDDDYITYSTGILPLDYANGYWQEVTINGEKKFIPQVGIAGGTFISIIGNTGTGKTTFADQMAYNIIRPFKNSTLHHIDAEATANRQRLIQITGASYDDPRIRISKGHCSIEDVLDMKTAICEAKEKGGDEYKYEIKNRSYDGKTIKAYVPTVFVIDSLPAFNSAEYNTDDLGNNIDQMRAAKDITRFFTNCLRDAWTYNLIFIIINHIRPKADMNPYAAPPKGIMMLGPAETLPRGYVAQFYSNTYFRINAKKSDVYTLEDNGFTGYKSIFQLAKSKTNQVGTSFPVAFNSSKGFDPVYTLYEFANAMGMISGKNPYLRFTDLEQYKFNRKDFSRMMTTNPEFQREVLLLLKPKLEMLLGEKPQSLMSADELHDSGEISYGELSMPED